MKRLTFARATDAIGPFLQSGGWVLLLAGLLLFCRLDFPLLEPDEGRYAELPRLMFERGDYLIPKLGGKAYNDKPPLVYWFIAMAYAVLGEGHAVARLVPAVASWLTVLAVFLWSRRWLGNATAVWSCLILSTMVGFVAFGRMLLLDSVLTLFVVTSFFSGLNALQDARLNPGWWLVSASLMGLGFMSKGPVAVVLVAPILFSFRWLDPASARWRWRDWLVYGGVVSVIALPWHIWMVCTVETFGPEFIWRHHILRYLKPYHHEKPWWYFIPTVLVEWLPWTGLVPLAAWSWRKWPVPVRTCGVAAVWCFLFFSFSRAKLPTYILPVLPLSAIVLGHALQDALSQAAVWRRWGRALFGGIATMAIVMGLRGHVLAHFLNHDLHRLDYVTLMFIPAALLLCWGIGSPRVAVRGFAALAVLGAAIIAWHTIPHFAREASKGILSAQLAAEAKNRGVPTVAYRGSWEASSFYIDDGELPVFHLEDQESLVKCLKEMRQALILVRPHEGRLEELIRAIPTEFDIAHVHYDPRVCGVYVHPYLDRPPVIPYRDGAAAMLPGTVNPMPDAR